MSGSWIFLSENIRKAPLYQGSEYTLPEIQESSVMPGFWLFLSWNIRKVPFPEN